MTYGIFSTRIAGFAALALAATIGLSSASAATITIKKVLLPAGDPGLFTLQLKKNNLLIATFQNGSGGAQVGPVNAQVGTYTVGEVAGTGTNMANYTSVVSGAGCIPLPGGGATVVVTPFTPNRVCTITNTRIQTTGQLRFKKVVVPGTPAAYFNLFIKDGNNNIVSGGQMQNATNNTILGPVTLTPGTYNLSETAGTNTVLADYTQSFGGTGCNANGTVNVTAGSNILCTLTNTKKQNGTITVKKVTVPANIPGAKFTLFVNNANSVSVGTFYNATAPVTLNPMTLTAGTYTVGEVAGTGTNLANYTTTITGAGCSPTGVVNLTAGANVTCTITNTLIVQPCTGYPMQATVNIYGPGTPFGPQTVDICRGGTVKFFNSNHGAGPTISTIGSPPSPFSVTLPAPNGSSVLTPPLNNTGTDNYLISGFTLPGHIIIH